MKLSIFLYCANEFERSVRCINSVIRQKNPNIDMELIFDSEDTKNQVLEAISPYSPKCIIKGERTNKDAFSELIETSDCDYFMMAYFNQAFAMGCFDDIENTLSGYDGAIVNYSYRKVELFYKMYDNMSYASFFSTAPCFYNVIFKTDVFKSNPVYFSLAHEEQPLFVASYFSYAKEILFLDTVFYYRDFKPSTNVFMADITYQDVWWIEKISSKLNKIGKKDCAVSFLGLYLDRIPVAKSQAHGIWQKLKFRYFSKKFAKTLF